MSKIINVSVFETLPTEVGCQKGDAIQFRNGRMERVLRKDDKSLLTLKSSPATKTGIYHIMRYNNSWIGKNYGDIAPEHPAYNKINKIYGEGIK
jgi:hypothetical protein